jgi:hypothetical protein
VNRITQPQPMGRCLAGSRQRGSAAVLLGESPLGPASNPESRRVALYTTAAGNFAGVRQRSRTPASAKT